MSWRLKVPMISLLTEFKGQAGFLRALWFGNNAVARHAHVACLDLEF